MQHCYDGFETAYTEKTLDHALKRGLQVTAIVRAEVIELTEGRTRAEQALAEDAAKALNEANDRLERLLYCLPNEKGQVSE